MRPFNLEAAKRGEPIQTRDGEAMRFVAYVPEIYMPCERLLLVSADGDLHCRNADGRTSGHSESPNDVVMAPRIVTLYLNVRHPEGRTSDNSYCGASYYDQADAKRAARSAIGGAFALVAHPVEVELP